MIFRECKCCGHPMDPGEGRNGMCDECVTGGDRAAAARREDGVDDPGNGMDAAGSGGFFE